MTHRSPIAVWKIACLAAAFSGVFAAAARAEDDESYEKFLKKNGLTAAECIEQPPADLFGAVAENHKLGYDGTPGYEELVMELFYQKYCAALRPAVNASAPGAGKMRAPLQKLLYTIFDFMAPMKSHRTYLTHGRVDAYAEHILSDLYRENGDLPLTDAVDGHFTQTDVVTFARVKAALSTNDMNVARPHYDAYVAELAKELDAVEKADTTRSDLNIRYAVIDFIDRFEALLDPIHSEDDDR